MAKQCSCSIHTDSDCSSYQRQRPQSFQTFLFSSKKKMEREHDDVHVCLLRGDITSSSPACFPSPWKWKRLEARNASIGFLISDHPTNCCPSLIIHMKTDMTQAFLGTVFHLKPWNLEVKETRSWQWSKLFPVFYYINRNRHELALFTHTGQQTWNYNTVFTAHH